MAKIRYLQKDRLANAIAGIQILGVSDQPSASVDRWVAELESMEELTPEQPDLARVKFAERKKWGDGVRAAALGTIPGGTIVIVLGWMQMTHMIRLFN